MSAAQETTQRMLTLPDGKRIGLTLEGITWAAIDRLAAEGQTDWRQWCINVLKTTPDSANQTRAVRAAVTEGLMFHSFLQDRADLMRRPQPAVLALSGTFDDRDFDADLRTAQSIDGEEDYGGFSLLTGVDQFGRVCFWIRNNLRNSPNCIIPLPFTPAQINDALGSA